MPNRALVPALLILSFSAFSAGAAEGPDAAPQDTSLVVADSTPSAGLPPQTSAQTTAAVQPIPAQPPRYSGEILSALKHLSALLAKGSLVDQKGLDKVAKEISELDARVTGLLGPAIIRQLEEEEKELLARAQVAAARAELRKMRALLLAYYSDGDGKYPGTPAELIPDYIPALPELQLPWHAKTGALALVGGTGRGPAEAAADSGGWLYFTDPGSAYFGMLILDCSHKDENGVELYAY